MPIPDYEYPNTSRRNYGGALFVPVCPNCRRYVTADKSIMIKGTGEIVEKPNATCSKCGRVSMPFEGYFDYA